MLDELKDAASKIKTDVKADDKEKECDRAYKFDFGKWVKYANSMRMRLAMRLSEVDAAKAKAEYEDAAKGAYICSSVWEVSHQTNSLPVRMICWLVSSRPITWVCSTPTIML